MPCLKTRLNSMYLLTHSSMLKIFSSKVSQIHLIFRVLLPNPHIFIIGSSKQLYRRILFFFFFVSYTCDLQPNLTFSFGQYIVTLTTSKNVKNKNKNYKTLVQVKQLCLIVFLTKAFDVCDQNPNDQESAKKSWDQKWEI